MGSPKHLKTIRFEGEMLPKWAQILDLAARLCPVSEEARSWFSKFTMSSDVDDAPHITIQCKSLLSALRDNKEAILAQLQRTPKDSQAPIILAAWEYALATMIQQAYRKKNCSWVVEDLNHVAQSDYGEGDISLRRV